FLVALENLRGTLRKNDGSERPEGLPVLDTLVELVLHFGRARVRQNAAVSQRAGPELRAPLEPSEYVALRQQPGGVGANVVAVCPVRFEAGGPSVERRALGVFRVGDAQVGIAHHKSARPLQDLEMAVVGAADGNAVIARSRLNPDVVESGLVDDPAIADAVEADTARDAQVPGAGRLAQPSGPVEKHRLGIVLDLPGQVFPVRQGRALLPVVFHFGKPGPVELGRPLRDLELAVIEPDHGLLPLLPALART